MRKKLWRTYNVAGTPYRIFKVKGLNESGCQGACDPINYEIFIDADLKGNDLKRTLYHELRHAHQHETGLAEILDDQAKEMDAESTAVLICAILSKES